MELKISAGHCIVKLHAEIQPPYISLLQAAVFPSSQACDIPSKFSQHYAGQLEAGLPAYGFEIGNFAVQSELLLFTSPHLAALRTQVCEYINPRMTRGCSLSFQQQLLDRYQEVQEHIGRCEGPCLRAARQMAYSAVHVSADSHFRFT